LKDKLLTLVKIAITVGLMVYVFSKVDLDEVASQLVSANVWLILLALACYMGAITVNGVKWYVLLRAQDVIVPFQAVVQYIFVGFFFNNVLPANIGGDVMRGYGMARYTDRTAEAAVSVVVDRIIGLIAYMSAAAVMSIVVVIGLGYSQLRVLIYVAVVALVVIGGALAVLLSRRLRRLVGRLFRWRVLAPLAPMYEGISGAFDAYRFRYGTLVLAFCIALGGLMVSNLVNWLLFEAVGAAVNPVYILLFNPLIALVLIVPISIGGHGVIQGVYPFFYGLVGVPHEQAVAVSVLMSFVIIVGSLPGGVLWLRNRRAGDEQPAAVTASQPTS
jgi:hypothetical protein